MLNRRPNLLNRKQTQNNLKSFFEFKSQVLQVTNEFNKKRAIRKIAISRFRVREVLVTSRANKRQSPSSEGVVATGESTTDQLRLFSVCRDSQVVVSWSIGNTLLHFSLASDLCAPVQLSN